MLTAAVTRVRADERQTTYGPVEIAALLGDYDSALNAYVEAMSAAWGDSWTDGMANALDVPEYAGVGLLDIAPSDYDPLVVDSRPMVDYDRSEVRRVVAEGMDEGLSPTQIAQRIDELQNFGPARALRIARTENVRSQESGYSRRLARAVEAGVPIIGDTWLSDPAAALWERHHELMDGLSVAIGGLYTLPSGVQTPGPGLSGVAGEDVNCRCARKPKLAPR